MGVNLKLHVTTRLGLLPGEQPVEQELYIVDGASELIDELFDESNTLFSEPLPPSCWVNDLDPEAESPRKTHDAYGQSLTWTTAGEISRVAKIEDEWVHPKDITTMAFMREFGSNEPDRIVILELA